MFILLLSAKGLGQSGYSEIYGLLPLALATYFYFESNFEENRLNFAALFIGVACLVHQGIGVFFLSFLLINYIKFSKKGVLNFLIGFSIPYIFIALVYLIKENLAYLYLNLQFH